MSDTDANHVGVLLEQIVSKNQAVLEAVGDMSRDLAEHVRQPSNEGHVVKTRRLPW
jgi:hypothetical protein